MSTPPVDMAEFNRLLKRNEDYNKRKNYAECKVPIAGGPCGYVGHLAEVIRHAAHHFGCSMTKCTKCGATSHDWTEIIGHKIGERECQPEYWRDCCTRVPKETIVAYWRAKSVFIVPVTKEVYDREHPKQNTGKVRDSRRTPVYEEDDDPDEEKPAEIVSRARRRPTIVNGQETNNSQRSHTRPQSDNHMMSEEQSDNLNRGTPQPSRQNFAQNSYERAQDPRLAQNPTLQYFQTAPPIPPNFSQPPPSAHMHFQDHNMQNQPSLPIPSDTSYSERSVLPHHNSDLMQRLNPRRNLDRQSSSEESRRSGQSVSNPPAAPPGILGPGFKQTFVDVTTAPYKEKSPLSDMTVNAVSSQSGPSSITSSSVPQASERQPRATTRSRTPVVQEHATAAPPSDQRIHRSSSRVDLGRVDLSIQKPAEARARSLNRGINYSRSRSRSMSREEENGTELTHFQESRARQRPQGTSTVKVPPSRSRMGPFLFSNLTSSTSAASSSEGQAAEVQQSEPQSTVRTTGSQNHRDSPQLEPQGVQPPVLPARPSTAPEPVPPPVSEHGPPPAKKALLKDPKPSWKKKNEPPPSSNMTNMGNSSQPSGLPNDTIIKSEPNDSPNFGRGGASTSSTTYTGYQHSHPSQPPTNVSYYFNAPPPRPRSRERSTHRGSSPQGRNNDRRDRDNYRNNGRGSYRGGYTPRGHNYRNPDRY